MPELSNEELLALGKLMAIKRKPINKVTHVPLAHVYDDKLNGHMGNMNADGWDLMNVFIEAIGIEERFVMIWRKEL